MSIIKQLGSGSHFLKVVFRALSSLPGGGGIRVAKIENPSRWGVAPEL